MNLAFSAEQESFRDSLRRFFGERCDTKSVRRAIESSAGHDREVWRQMCGELGLCALHVPEAYGGQGFGVVELGIVLEEMGRRLVPGPYLASAVLGTRAILSAGTEERRRALLPGIAAGDVIATLAVTEPNGRWDAGGIATEARAVRGGWTLHGVKSFVLAGHEADLIVVAARLPGSEGADGLGLFTVPGDAAGLTRTLLPTLDATRRQARIELDAVAATPLGDPGNDGATLATTLDHAAVALACEMVGGAQAALDMAVEYAGVRVQFGRPIGSFQAIKHRCAEMLLAVETARSAAIYAARAAEVAPDELPIVASLAKAHCAEAFFLCAAESLQIHGGIAFTWEHDAHLFLRRAKTSEILFGDGAHHREQMLRRLGISQGGA